MATIQLPLVKEVLLDSPVEKVWQAITDPGQMKQWYFDAPEFAPTPGNRFSFWGENEGRKFLHLCEVKEAVPNKKITYTWTYERQDIETLVSFELFPEGDKTRLRLTHEGVEKLPQDRDFAISNFDAGWTEIIQQSLPKYLESK